MNISIIPATAVLALSAATSFQAMAADTNPFLQPYNTVYNIPPFESITYADYMPAFEQGIKERNQEIQAIIRNRAVPDFDNTILALEQSGELLNKVMLVFSSLNETDSSPEMEALAEKIMPLYSQASDEIMMNPMLFNKVKQVIVVRSLISQLLNFVP